MRPDTLEAFRKLRGDPPLRCPCQSDSAFYKFWRSKIIKPAGIRPGALQQMRRTGASLLAITNPEAVQAYLGHSSPEMKRFYLDESISIPERTLPPELKKPK